MNKEQLRKIMIKKRKTIINKKELSTIIVDKLLSLDIYKKSRVVAIYNSMKDEVDTSYLIKEAIKEKIILLPKVTGNKIVFIKINKGTKYLKSDFGVLEPIGDIYNDIIDLIIVPGLGFDNKLNRLGFGMGYYDNFLSQEDIYKIGLCFDEQIVDSIPTESHDIKMNMIITKNRVYK